MVEGLVVIVPPDDQGDNTVPGFSIFGNGDLTPLDGSPFPAGAGALNLIFPAMDPAGKFLYAAIITEEVGPAISRGLQWTPTAAH
jgi:hypothetical protein